MSTERKRKVSLIDVVDPSPVSKLAKINGSTGLNRWNGLPYSQRYYEILEKRKTLPVWQQKQEFLDALAKSRSLILVGETGSGKTTQLEQGSVHLPTAIDVLSTRNIEQWNGVPDEFCTCGHGKMLKLASKTQKNPNRPFLKCAGCRKMDWIEVFTKRLGHGKLPISIQQNSCNVSTDVSSQGSDVSGPPCFACNEYKVKNKYLEKRVADMEAFKYLCFSLVMVILTVVVASKF